MLQLKQYGDSASNFLKKLAIKPKKKLQYTLFLQPLSIILAAFILLFLSFNIFVHLFINQETFKAVNAKSHELESLYQQVPNRQNPMAKSIFETSYMIVNDDKDIVYNSLPMHDKHHRFDTENLLEFFFDKEHHQDQYQNTGIAKINVRDNNYSVKLIAYRGIRKDYYISRGSSPKVDRNYYVLIFVNTSPMQHFLDLVNLILALIMVITFAITVLIIYLTSKRLNHSFKTLQNYVLAAGNRKTDSSSVTLPYDEFNQVVRTVDRMTEMIASNQRSQELFFQNSSHELRTPLMSIQSYAEAIHKNLVDSQAASRVILEESHKMSGLVDDILTISRLELIPDKLDLELLNLSDLIYDVSWRLKKKAELAGIEIQHQLSSQEIQLYADEELLERAILNILSNAVRYAKSKIQISSQMTKTAAIITIANDGPAISPEEIDHLFERFYKGKAGNHGIGLAMTKDIIQSHGGHIKVRSNQDETAFMIELPLKQN